MDKRRKLLILLLVVCLILFGLCGSALAYMFAQTENKENMFTPAEVSCWTHESFDGVQKSSIEVQNTGNIDAYIRVRLVSYWVDANDNIVAKPSTMPMVTLGSDWLKGPDNTYYYQKPVPPTDGQDMTSNMLGSPLILSIDEEGNRQVVEVFAEAIQSKPKKAVGNSWNVTIGENNYITAVN